MYRRLLEKNVMILTGLTGLITTYVKGNCTTSIVLQISYKNYAATLQQWYKNFIVRLCCPFRSLSSLGFCKFKMKVGRGGGKDIVSIWTFSNEHYGLSNPRLIILK